MSPLVASPGVWKNRRTRKATVTFQQSFTLNRHVGELPPGPYDVEIDEEEIQAADRTAYRQTGIYFYVQNAASTRMMVVTPAELDSALKSDVDLSKPGRD